MTVIAGGIEFKTKKSFEEHWTNIVNKYAEGIYLYGSDEHFIKEALALTSSYSKASTKADSKFLIVKKMIRGYKVRGIAISYSNKVIFASKQKVLSEVFGTKQRVCDDKKHAALVKKAMRDTVSEYMREKRKELKNKLRYDDLCPLSGKRLMSTKTHVDHYSKPFSQIVEDFMREHEFDFRDLEVKQRGAKLEFSESHIADAFYNFHHDHADLRLVDATENLKKSNKQI